MWSAETGHGDDDDDDDDDTERCLFQMRFILKFSTAFTAVS